MRKKQSTTKNRLRTSKDIKTLDDYDFVDLGAGDGGSLENIKRVYGGEGVGIELDKNKVERAQKLNRNVVIGDALKLHEVPGKSDIVTCDNFLEHLPTFNDVENMLRQAMNVAKNFIYIRHPAFEEDEYLKRLGLKTYWSDWTGHTAMLRMADFTEIFMRIGLNTFKMVPVGVIKDSTSEHILPIDTAPDQFEYDKSKHGKKPKVVFDRGIYYAFDIVAMIPGSEIMLPRLGYKNQLGRTKHPEITYEVDKVKGKYERRIQRMKSTPGYRVGTKIDRVIKR